MSDKSGRLGSTDNGRTLITKYGEEPKSARGNKRYYQLWKLAMELTLDEINMLVTKRRTEIRYKSDQKEIRILRTEILLLEDCYKIVRRK